MKQLLILFSLIILQGCKSINPSSIEEKKIKQICDIHVESIPNLEFNNKKVYHEKDFKYNTLFNSFIILKVFDNLNGKDDNYYYEMSKRYNKDKTSNRFKEKVNKYVFYKLENGNFRLVSSEITFNSDLIFNDALFVEPIQNQNEKEIKRKADLFKIKYNNFLIDIGMKKADFAKIFKQNINRLCDTVNVHNDTDESWYVFKKNSLDKIIIESYID